MSGQHRIVVLGAGYAGLAAARRSAKAPGARVTVVDARAEFVERVRLHQAAAGQSVAHRNLRKILERRGIRFVQGMAVGIDTAGRQLALADGGTVEYDTLIYALGSRADLESVAGVRDYALSVATADDVEAMRPLRGRVLVVGGGATGIETAAELAESRPDLSVALVSSEEPGAWLSDRARGHIRATLERLGVSVRAGVKVVEVLADGVRTADGETLPAESVLWTTGFAVPDLAARAGLAVDARGRLLVDEQLRTSDPAVYAAGDCAVVIGPDGRELRMACATAIPVASRAAAVVTARLRATEPPAPRFRYYLQCISLGRRDAVIQFLRADDTPTPRALTGRPAAWVKEAIVRGAARVARP
ncbi:NAD(P)/FAD-dependent oxidoreductase [Nocardia pseudobrasiliensis]|uniref:NADH dehydrogenase FAD-containing subunit n=1 Tax=Nocardia pseudobrasiliensis TaxID=45979 RepID=A0A370HME5_9NOCA|nr:FAD-dependent oxidoreductase [Nocardia pseudobrasiliensis]RDI59743.1 NADH dehydrogenase FAD-containing subunit [Nocardia pseudobrasiliensis]